AYGDRILRYDRARECTHERLMRLRHLAGDRAGALRQYERCAFALEEELGVRPAERTVDLYERIRADAAVPDRSPVPRRTQQALPAENDPATLLPRLEAVRARVADLAREVQDAIAAVEGLRGKGQAPSP